jgi:hypothetical protein
MRPARPRSGSSSGLRPGRCPRPGHPAGAD